MDLVTEKIVEEGKNKSHDDSLAVAPNSDIYIERVEAIEACSQNAQLYVLGFASKFSVFKQFGNKVTGDSIEDCDDNFAEILM